MMAAREEKGHGCAWRVENGKKEGNECQYWCEVWFVVRVRGYRTIEWLGRSALPTVG